MSDSKTLSLPAAAMWASAFVIGALTIVQAGRLPQAAYGEMVASHGDYTILTTNSGRGGDLDPNEILYVIDNRAEVLLVYEIEDARRGQVILRDGGSLRALFHRARP